MNTISNLLFLTKGKEIVLFGELHGTKEIPNLLKRFFRELAESETFNIALEIPMNCQSSIDTFLMNGNEQYLKTLEFFKNISESDGRNSREYLELIKDIYKINKHKQHKIFIFCIELDSFSSGKTAQEEKEEALTKKVLDLAKYGYLFVILGDIHAAKRIITFGDKKIVPAGYRIHSKLNGKVISIRLSPQSGSFFNVTKKIVSQENKSFDNYFDYAILLKKVSPCSFIS